MSSPSSPSPLLRIGLITIVLLTGLTMLGSVMILSMSLLRDSQSGDSPPDLMPVILTAASLLLIGSLLAHNVRIVWRHWHRPSPEPAYLAPLSVPSALALFGLWLLALFTATLLYATPVLRWITIPAYLVAIGLPVYVLLRLSIGGRHLLHRWRVWLTFSMGMTLSPFLAVLVEGSMFLLVIMIMLISFLSANAQNALRLSALAEQLEQMELTEATLMQIASLLNQPLIFLFGMLFLAIFTPLVEEIAKSLAIWLHVSRLRSPWHGFALGALAGAGFGLVESAWAAVIPDETWGAALTIRAATSAMHILTTALTGWGIGYWLSGRSKAAVGLGYGLAIGIHALWNLSVLVIVSVAIRLLVLPDDPGNLILSTLLGLLALGTIGLLILITPVALWFINRHLRSLSESGL